MAKCVRKGCGKTFSADENGPDVCVYHSGPPVFHEGLKGWTCCKPRVLTFDEFLTIPPCSRGSHTDVEPVIVTIDKDAKESDESVNNEKSNEQSTGRAPLSDVFAAAMRGSNGSDVQTAISTSKTTEEDKAELEIQSDDEDGLAIPGTTCRRRGCGKVFESTQPLTKSQRQAVGNDNKNPSGWSENTGEVCVYHPSTPLFHEGSKGWRCCKRRVLEFDEMFRIVGCETKLGHVFVKPDGQKKPVSTVGSTESGSVEEGRSKDSDQEDLFKTVRHDMYQSSKNVTVSFYLKDIDPTRSTISFSDSADSTSSSILNLALETKDGRKIGTRLELFAPIKPDLSKFDIRKTKIELVLVKDVDAVGPSALGWPGLVRGSTSSGAILQVGGAGKA